MLSQIRWHQPNAEANPLGYLNVVRWCIQWWNSRQMNRYIGAELDERYAELKADTYDTRRKAVIDLVLQAYMAKGEKVRPEKLDPVFRAFATRQMRLFLFTGHDSTSSTICYAMYLLFSNPTALASLCAEHDEIFGKDISALPSMLDKQTHLINDLPYTTAVIKEVLRLFPPAGSSRQGKENVSITDDQGNICPTDDAVVWLNHVEMQRSEKYWVRPAEFLPERWLVEPGHELYPMKGAWRPFEHGPRNCVAQILVMTELRVVLACLVRQIEVKPAYGEWDRLHPRKGPKTYRGERAYQIEKGSAHPVDYYPCRIFLRR